MAITEFPPVETADEYGLLAIGGDLEVESLLLAYTKGIFPWPISHDSPITWFSPDPRGVLEFSDLHLSRTLKKEIKQYQFDCTMNQSFEEVIRACAEVRRKSEDSTWITEELIQGYCALHRAGFAYSLEVWNGHNLVGGIYGVHINSFVSGESMFYHESGASKFALISLIDHLKDRDIQWIDTQMLSPVVKSLGGKEISRAQFLTWLNTSLNQIPRPDLFP